MKKLTTILAALGLFLSANAFATVNGDDDFYRILKVAKEKSVKTTMVNSLVSNAFKQKFSKAENVNWSKIENFYFASFQFKQTDLTVAYGDNGEFIAVSRNVSLEQIPFAIADAINEKYKDYVIPSHVTEIAFLGETSYYLTVEGKTSYRQLKCYSNGEITVEKKIKKKVLIGNAY